MSPKGNLRGICRNNCGLMYYLWRVVSHLDPDVAGHVHS